MTSHTYAERLKEIADFLLSKPEFIAPHDMKAVNMWFWYNKDNFLAAVKALGSGTKTYKDDDLEYHASGYVTLYIKRDKVCRKVREAEYECEPLLSKAEMASL